MTSGVDMMRCVDEKVGVRPVLNAEIDRLLLMAVIAYSGKAGRSEVLLDVVMDARGGRR